jgi:hypothetical protein
MNVLRKIYLQSESLVTSTVKLTSKYVTLMIRQFIMVSAEVRDE